MAQYLSEKILKRTNSNIGFYRWDTYGPGSYTVGANTKFIMLTMCAAGGGGGGARDNNTSFNIGNVCGGGGGAGAHLIDLVLKVYPGQVWTTQVGRGGAPGVGTYGTWTSGTGYGTNGGDTYIATSGALPGRPIGIYCRGGRGGNAYDTTAPGVISTNGRASGGAPGWVDYFIDTNDSVPLNSYGWVSDAGQERFNKVVGYAAGWYYGRFIRWGADGGSQLTNVGGIGPPTQIPTISGHTFYTDTDNTSRLRYFGKASNPADTHLSGGSGGSSFFGQGGGGDTGQGESSYAFGGGGAGAGCASTSDNQAARTGGWGTRGFIKIHEFYEDDPMTLFTSNNWSQFVNESSQPSEY